MTQQLNLASCVATFCYVRSKASHQRNWMTF